MKLLAMIGVIGIIASYNGLIIGCIRQLQCPDTTVVQNFDREQVTFIGSNLKISYGFCASKYEVTQALYINSVYSFSS